MALLLSLCSLTLLSVEPVPPARVELVADSGVRLLTNRDLRGYDWATHSLLLSPKADLRALRKLAFNGGRFWVVVDGVRVYSGHVTSQFSSTSRSGPVIVCDRAGGPPRTITVQLGYPSRAFHQEADPRGQLSLNAALCDLNLLRNP